MVQDLCTCQKIINYQMFGAQISCIVFLMVSLLFQLTSSFAPSQSAAIALESSCMTFDFLMQSSHPLPCFDLCGLAAAFPVINFLRPLTFEGHFGSFVGNGQLRQPCSFYFRCQLFQRIRRQLLHVSDGENAMGLKFFKMLLPTCFNLVAASISCTAPGVPPSITHSPPPDFTAFTRTILVTFSALPSLLPTK